MASIAGVTVPTFSLPENDTRKQNVTLGKATDGSFKFYKFRSSDRMITITVSAMTGTVKDALIAALEGDADYNVAIVPPSWVDLGAGAGTSINAQWIDPQFDARKSSHEFWTVTLNFQRVV